MARRRVLQAVVHNFLHTFTSRASDLQGYWLFGFLVADLQTLHLDLLNPSSSDEEGEALQFARMLASTRFAEQMTKARVPMSKAVSAEMWLERLPDQREGLINMFMMTGWPVRFLARIITPTGIHFQAERALFVAPWTGRERP